MTKNLSKHISAKEATRSLEAVRNGLENIPTNIQWNRMKLLADNVFEPLREYFDVPIYIHSMFRSPKVNKLIGGAIHSQHLCNEGAAVDMDADVYNSDVTNVDLFNYIKDNLEFTQLIAENIDKIGNIDWVHVGYTGGKNRKEILVMYVKDGKVCYVPYDEEKGLLLNNYSKKYVVG